MSIDSAIVNVEWLDGHLADANTVVLYTRCSAPGTNQLPPQPDNFIPNSQLFDFEETFCDTDSGLPHMLPTQDCFQANARLLGICQDSQVVVYDQNGLATAPRVWWMFKVFGFSNVKVLAGGLTEWLAAHPDKVGSLMRSNGKGDMLANFQPELVYAKSQIKSAKDFVLLDARSAARFSGQVPDPRSWVKAGHIPKSQNLPFELVINNGHLEDKRKIAPYFDTDLPLVFSCGSGVTACILALAAHECGNHDWSVYDGSWAEWGSTETDIETIETIEIRNSNGGI